jgi:hypothetical protein
VGHPIDDDRIGDLDGLAIHQEGEGVLEDVVVG